MSSAVQPQQTSEQVTDWVFGYLTLSFLSSCRGKAWSVHSSPNWLHISSRRPLPHCYPAALQVHAGKTVKHFSLREAPPAVRRTRCPSQIHEFTRASVVFSFCVRVFVCVRNPNTRSSGKSLRESTATATCTLTPRSCPTITSGSSHGTTCVSVSTPLSKSVGNEWAFSNGRRNL